jgi:hypothetical protein
VGVGIGVGLDVIVAFGVIECSGVDKGVDVAGSPEFTPHPTRAAKSNNANNKMPALKKMVSLFIMVSIDGLLCRPTVGGSAAWQSRLQPHVWLLITLIFFSSSII